MDSKNRGGLVNDAVLDLDVLGRICEWDTPEGLELARKLVGMYLQKTPQGLAAIAEAVNDRNYDLVRRTAHNLKSTSANLGAGKMRSLFERLEQCSDGDCRDKLDGIFNELQAQFQTVKSALEEALDKKR